MRLPIFRTICLLFLPSLLFAAGENGPQPPETQIGKESYSIGYQVGLSIKSDEVEVDFGHLVQGLQDAIKGNEARLALADMKKLIVELRTRARETALKKLQEQTVTNAEESEKFLAQNGKKKGVRTTESGLQYKVLRSGDGAAPGPADRVRVNYRGMFIDGKEFDSSYLKGEPQTVQADGVIKGWTEALRMMTTGSKWQVFVPPHLAYGRSGLGQKIPPNKLLVFEIELLSIESKEAKKDGN